MQDNRERETQLIQNMQNAGEKSNLGRKRHNLRNREAAFPVVIYFTDKMDLVCIQYIMLFKYKLIKQNNMLK